MGEKYQVSGKVSSTFLENISVQENEQTEGLEGYTPTVDSAYR